MKWQLHLRDGRSTEVEADEVVVEGFLRFVDNAVDGAALAERYVDKLIVAAGVWAVVESADAGLRWAPPADAAPPRVPETF